MTRAKLEEENRLMRKALQRIVDFEKEDVPEEYKGDYAFMFGCIHMLAKHVLDTIFIHGVGEE